jgi:hypothetical protein
LLFGLGAVVSLRAAWQKEKHAFRGDDHFFFVFISEDLVMGPAIMACRWKLVSCLYNTIGRWVRSLVLVLFLPSGITDQGCFGLG